VVCDYAEDDVAFDLDQIIDFVCRSYGLSRVQLTSKSRKRQVVMARNTAFYLARQHTDLSLKDIGQSFNRQHSTVIKGITNVEREVNLETPTGRQLSRTMEMLGSYKFYR
jgi:chromosomal replication initiator protein